MCQALVKNLYTLSNYSFILYVLRTSYCVKYLPNNVMIQVFINILV